jgi:branched-chain amino acid aminotransferase
MDQPIAYLNGQMLPAAETALPIYDAGVVLGATVTEMTRTFGGRLFRLDDHLDRLFRSIRYVRFDVALSKDDLRELSHKLVEHNLRLVDEGDELGLIQFVTAGSFPTYAGMAGRQAPSTPTVCMHTFPLPFELWAGKFEQGVHVVTPSIRHVPPQCYDPKMKYRSRMHYYLADKEAQLVDRDAVALLLDLDGNVTETGGANFLIVQDGAIVSPTLRNILPGVSRKVVFELAQRLGIRTAERDIQVHDVVNADEAFTTSTPYCLMPVTRVNGIPIGSGRPGPLFARLARAWSEQVGIDLVEQIQRGAQRRTARCETVPST